MRSGRPAVVAGGAVKVPAAVFLITLWAVRVRPHRRSRVEQLAFPAVPVAVLMAARSPAPDLLAALAAADLVVVVTLVDRAARLRREGP